MSGPSGNIALCWSLHHDFVAGIPEHRYDHGNYARFGGAVALCVLRRVPYGGLCHHDRHGPKRPYAALQVTNGAILRNGRGSVAPLMAAARSAWRACLRDVRREFHGHERFCR